MKLQEFVSLRPNGVDTVGNIPHGDFRRKIGHS
jgi:hypothetical protein